MDKMDIEELLPKHGGFRKLKSFQLARLCYDVTVRFCERYVDRRSRTFDQMVQAARSGVQNIAEGSVDSGTSKKSELKLTNIACGSLEELRLDYQDYLRQRRLQEWPKEDPAGMNSCRAAAPPPTKSPRGSNSWPSAKACCGRRMDWMDEMD